MILILAEKPSAASNFAKALGGREGTYNGESYRIVSSHGHIYTQKNPEDMVSKELKPRYHSWNPETMPWQAGDIHWAKTRTESASIYQNIMSAASGCDEICIATDSDPTGEGELLAWEIIDGLKLKANRYTRLDFEDETPKNVQYAFRHRRLLGTDISCMYSDPDFKQADFRSKWDMLSVQWSRISTSYAHDATSLRLVLRQGRLKSVMVKMTGDQLKAVKEYVKKPFFQNRFRDENGVVYANPKEPTFPDKKSVPKKYHESDVILDKTERKHTAPPKFLDLASLSARLASRGLSAKTILATYQNMYEAHIVSYPRTDDKVITPEQFNELLPLADDIAGVVGVDPAFLTHRSPRPTHIKASGVTHGANRPGTVVPESLEDLKQYGTGAAEIYTLLAKNYLATLAEDYEFDKQYAHVKDYPDFKGSADIPKIQGWKMVYSDASADADADENAKGIGAKAAPFIYEGANPKPSVPTMQWLMKQLEKNDVGTGATRTSIFGEVSNPNVDHPLIQMDKKGKLSFFTEGEISYRMLPGTYIGDVRTTEFLQQQMRDIKAGRKSADVCLGSVEKMVGRDMVTMKKNAEDIAKSGEFGHVREDYTGVWQGRSVSFSRYFTTRRLTDEECERLCAGENIILKDIQGKTGTYNVECSLGDQDHNGRKWFGVGVVRFFRDDDGSRYRGVWNGREVNFKRLVLGHELTDEECERLCNGEEITIQAKGKDGSEYTASGSLADQEYKGTKYVGFKKTEKTNEDDPEKYHGIFKKKKVSFKRNFSGHYFTDAECEALCAGKEIEVKDFKKKDGTIYSGKGTLKKQTWNGAEYYGFAFSEKEARKGYSDDGVYYYGTWKKRNIRFKCDFRGYHLSEEECKKLCAGKTIEIQKLLSKAGKLYNTNVKLTEKEYNGNKYVAVDSAGFAK